MSTNWPFPSGRPAVITAFELDRSAVLAGEPVTVHWRTENAGTVRITPPDGFPVDLDARSGSGAHRIVVRNSGIVMVTAWGADGKPVEAARPVAVFAMPDTVEVPVPGLRETPMPGLVRTPIGVLARSAGFVRGEPFAGVRGPRVRPAWAVPPVELMSVAPVRSPGRVTPPPVRSWFDLGGGAGRPGEILRRVFAGRPRRPADWRFVQRRGVRR